jgi:hypothetical protein
MARMKEERRNKYVCQPCERGFSILHEASAERAREQDDCIPIRETNIDSIPLTLPKGAVQHLRSRLH